MQDRYDKSRGEPLAYQTSGSMGLCAVPSPGGKESERYRRAYRERYYRFIANKAPLMAPLWNETLDGKRVRFDLSDDGPAIRAANMAYRAALPLMHTRTLLPDGAGVLWQAEKGRKRVVFCFKRTVLPLDRRTRHVDLTTGERGTCGTEGLEIERAHTYVITGMRHEKTS